MNKLGSLPLGSVIFRTVFQLEGKGVGKIYTVEPRFYKPLCNKVLSITNDFLYPLIVKHVEKNLDVTKPCYSDHMLPVPWPFVISRFHYDLQSDGCPRGPTPGVNR